MNAPDFQDLQRAFGRHIRDPRLSPRPAGVPARRMAVYNELLFNNICGFLDSCFPVCRATLGEKRWRRLNRSYFRDWPSHTPWFREIPREFVRYLNEAEIKQALPAWFAELAHYGSDARTGGQPAKWVSGAQSKPDESCLPVAGARDWTGLPAAQNAADAAFGLSR